jgi:5-deoxy-glucuronate isomerase
MLIVLNQINEGYNEITNVLTSHQNMLMDIGIQKLSKGSVLDLLDEEKETAILLLVGKVEFSWENQKVVGNRNSVFDESPEALHVSRGIKVKIKALEDTELIIQKTINEKKFEAKYYSKNDCSNDVFGENVWNDTARRTVRTVFDYKNAPYSNMVMGEVINFPGKWSSYIPHGHDQPEVYFYKFDKESGFGAAFVGEEVFKIKNNSALCIKGGPTHPQVSAPGYPMYYCWMIRHLPDNPWTTRVDDQRYTWLLDKEVKIWPNR